MLTSTTFRGQPCIELSLPAGDCVRIALHGAHVLSWTTADGVERLYLSPRAHFDGHSPIRGGVPVCFPQFNQRVLGDVVLPKHGFARTSTWAVADGLAAVAEGEAQVVLRLQSDAVTRALWPHDFDARLTVTLSTGKLRVRFDVRNTGADAWPFALALHTYLQVDGVQHTALSGLQGLEFWDSVQHPGQPDIAQLQPAGALGFDGETDRVYAGATTPLAVRHPGGTLGISQSESLADVVVWNPAAERCATLDDMPADGWRHMLCVEAARINDPVSLAPGQSWGGWQELCVIA